MTHIVKGFKLKFEDGTSLTAPLVSNIKDFIGVETPKMVVYIGLQFFMSTGIRFSLEVWKVDGEFVMANIINLDKISELN